MVLHLVDAQRLGRVHERAQHTVPVRQPPHPRPGLRVDPDMDELGEVSGRPSYTERPVAGIDQPRGRLDDPPQRRVEFESGTDGEGRLEQLPQPVRVGPDLQIGAHLPQ